MGFTAGYCQNAEQYHKEALSIPMYPAMSETQQDRVIQILSEILA